MMEAFIRNVIIFFNVMGIAVSLALTDKIFLPVFGTIIVLIMLATSDS